MYSTNSHSFRSVLPPLEQLVDRRSAPPAGHGTTADPGQDQLYPASRKVPGRIVTLGLGDRIAIEQQRQVASSGRHDNTAHEHAGASLQTETIIVVLTSDEKAYRLNRPGSATAGAVHRSLETGRFAGMKIRNPQPDGLIVSFDLDEVFVTGSQKPGDGLDDGIGSHRNALRGHIHIGFEVALIAPENSPAARVETHMVAHRALGKRIVAVQPDQTARFDDPESIGRKHGLDAFEREVGQGGRIFPLAAIQ